MDKVVPDSERISCEELEEYMLSIPEVRCRFENSEEKHSEAIKTIVFAKRKLKNAINNL